LIAMKDWAKPPSDHVDLYHLGIRFVGFITAEFVVEIDFSAQIYLFSYHKYNFRLDRVLFWWFFIEAFVDLVSVLELTCATSDLRSSRQSYAQIRSVKTLGREKQKQKKIRPGVRALDTGSLQGA
jgi:hypothetical protein